MLAECDPLELTDAPALESRYDSKRVFKTRKLKMSPAAPSNSRDRDWSALILRVRDVQDETAFAELFNHFAPRIKGFLVKSGASAQVAEDVAQDTMVTVWQKAKQFDPMRASASTWIFTIARNKRIDIFRRAARPEPEDLAWGPEPEPDVSERLVLEQETRQLTKALEELPNSQRDIVKRAYYGDLSHTELAQETGLPLGTIKSRIRLALTRLRKTLNEPV